MIKMLPLAMLVLTTAAPQAQKPAAQTQKPLIACRLLTFDEVARFSGGAPVEIDPKQSGEDDSDGSSSCTWQVKGGKLPPVVILTVENGDTPGAGERVLGTKPAEGRVAAKFSLRKMQAFGNPPPPTAVPGLGDEALYRDFERVKGGALLVRRGAQIVTFSGSVHKDAYIALARLVLQRI